MRFTIPDLTNPNAHPRAVRRAVGHRAAEVRQAMHDHKALIRPMLSPALQQLQDTQLHDGLIQSLWIDPGQKSLRLFLLCDDREGNFDLTLHYNDIELTQLETSLLCLLAHTESAEIARDELDIDESKETPTFIHRILWNTRVLTDYESTGPNSFGEDTGIRYTLQPETEFRFGGLEIERVPRTDRKLVRPKDFITLVRDPNQIEGMESVIINL